MRWVPSNRWPAARRRLPPSDSTPAWRTTTATTNWADSRGVFNDTLARLEKAFEQLRRFTSDASHELRTPLAMIRSVGEVGLQKDGTRAEYRDIVGSMLEEVNRMTSLLDNLLTISRADSGHIQLHRAVVPVLTLVRGSGRDLRVF